MRPVTITQTGAGSTPWVVCNRNVADGKLSVACQVTGTVNYRVEYTYQDVNYSPTSSYAYVVDNPSVNVFPDVSVNGLTVSAVAVQTNPVAFARVTVASGNGSVQATFLNGGLAGP